MTGVQTCALPISVQPALGDIAERWLDWGRLGPMVERYVGLIEADVGRDTRKHGSTEAFRMGIFGATGATTTAANIRAFAELRRAALLNHEAVREARGQK